MTFWPADLAPFYPHPRAALADWQVAAAAVLLAVITTLVLACARRRPYLAVGWFWYLGTLVPMIGLVQVGEQALADRYTYLPLSGIFIMIAFGLADLAARWPVGRAFRILAGLGVVSACAALSWRQIGFWHDSRTLWTHAVVVTSDNYLAENNLGGACLAGLGTLPEAEEHLREAVRIKPNYGRAWDRLGTAIDRQGRSDEAIAYYRRSLELSPNQARTRNNLAVALAKQGQLDEAIAQLQEATRLEPDFAEAQYSLVFALAKAKAPRRSHCRGPAMRSPGTAERAISAHAGNASGETSTMNLLHSGVLCSRIPVAIGLPPSCNGLFPVIVA